MTKIATHDTTVIRLTRAHMRLLRHIALNPGTDTGNGKMPWSEKRLIPGLYAAGLIKFRTQVRNVTEVESTPLGDRATRHPENLTFKR